MKILRVFLRPVFNHDWVLFFLVFTLPYSCLTLIIWALGTPWPVLLAIPVLVFANIQEWRLEKASESHPRYS